MAWAEWEFRLSQPQPGGSPPLRKVFADYHRVVGRKHPKDNWAYGPPAVGRYVLDWFWEISRGRGTYEGGYRPISAREINEWCVLRRVTLLPWETDALFRLDDKFMTVVTEK